MAHLVQQLLALAGALGGGGLGDCDEVKAKSTQTIAQLNDGSALASTGPASEQHGFGSGHGRFNFVCVCPFSSLFRRIVAQFKTGHS